MDSHPFTVIIVGGSIAGLALAHCLHHAEINHIVLEKRPEIAPQEGASIGLWPTGGQILDQLGLWGDVARGTEPLRKHNVLFPDGGGYSHGVLDTIYERFGYGLTFAERQRLLQVLYERYPMKERILVNKAVVEVEQSESGVSVTTGDGLIYRGSLVVGADGVHSQVRSEMWRIADLQSLGRITAQEKKALTAEFACVFGISSSIPGLQSGEHGNVYGDGVTVLTFHGKERVYWFLVSKMDRRYTYPDVPRFKPEDAEEMCCKRFAEVRIADGLCVRDLWENRLAASMLAMEEGLFETWSVGRVILIGDAVRKMTVNMGQGANCAIEDAAVLASLLAKLVQQESANAEPNNADIEATLGEFRERRYTRSKAIYGQTMFGARLYTRDNLVKKVMGRYVMPHKIEHMAEAMSTLIANGPVVDFLPLPPRSRPDWEKYTSHCLKQDSRQQHVAFRNRSVLVTAAGILALSVLMYSHIGWRKP